jgi:hypothetical protein
MRAPAPRWLQAQGPEILLHPAGFRRGRKPLLNQTGRKLDLQNLIEMFRF